MRPLIFLLIIISLTACNQKKAEIKSGAINSEAPFLWETGFPKTMYISDGFSTDEEKTKINEMFSAWESALNNYNFFTPSGSSMPEKFNKVYAKMPNLRDGDFVVYKATNWPYPDYPYALAITQIFAVRYNTGSGDEYVSIAEADIIVNYENFHFDEPGSFYLYYDFKTVVLHELGHFLGLQHKPTSYNRNNTVMYPSIWSANGDHPEIKDYPKTIDIQDMAEKYSITMPLTAGGSSITAQKKVYQKEPGDPGQPTHIILELRADGECVHHVDGVITSRHQTR